MEKESRRVDEKQRHIGDQLISKTTRRERPDEGLIYLIISVIIIGYPFASGRKAIFRWL